MAVMTAKESKLTISVDEHPYRLLRARVDEALSEVPTLRAEIGDSEALPAPKELIDKDCVFEIVPDAGAAYAFRGRVVRATRKDAGSGASVLEIIVKPAIHYLEKRRDVRMFQEKSVVDIVKAVLEEAGVTELEERLTGTYEPREMVVQYRETDYQFVTRLLAEEGIYFAHDFKEKSLLILADDPTGIGDAEDASIPFFVGKGLEIAKTAVRNVVKTDRVKSDKVLLRDYDFEQPRLDIKGEAESADPGEHALEVYAWHGRFNKDGDAKKKAEVVLDSIQAERDLVRGDTNSMALTPGLRFSIEQHPYEAMNQELLVTRTTTVVELGRVATGRTQIGKAGLGKGPELAPGAEGKVSIDRSFVAVPTETVKFRPPRVFPQARVPSMQVAKVTGPSGQEIHSDSHGRVKVFFPWDRVGTEDDKSSIWMRTSQLPTGGSMLVPRVGWEVAVQCDEGDPDRPLVMSRLYNAEKPPPYALPEGKARSSIQTATTPGGGSVNEMRMDDSGGSEEMFWNASKDMSMTVENSTTASVGNNETKDVSGNQELEVTNSYDMIVKGAQATDVGGNQSVNIETFHVEDTAADYSLTVGGNRDMKVGGDHKNTVGADSTLTVGSMHTNLVVGKVNINVAGDETRTTGAVAAALTLGDHATTAGGALSETSGAAKVIITFGGKSVAVTGSMTHMVAGAIIHKVDGDHSESSGGMYTEVATGASIVKATNVTYEAEAALTLVMGASILSLTPATVAILGTSVKIDGAVSETSAIILNN